MGIFGSLPSLKQMWGAAPSMSTPVGPSWTGSGGWKYQQLLDGSIYSVNNNTIYARNTSNWSAIWTEKLKLPVSAYGPGISVPSSAKSATAALSLPAPTSTALATAQAPAAASADVSTPVYQQAWFPPAVALAVVAVIGGAILLWPVKKEGG